MEGKDVKSALTLPSIGQDWTLAGLADGTGDGVPDVYWTKDGQVVIWEVGAAPEDVLTGGGGRDTFHFENRNDTGNVVTDFQAGAGGDVLGMQAVMGSMGLSGTNGLTAGAVRAFQNGASTEVQVEVRTGGGKEWVSFATLQNTTASSLTADNWSF
jgi:Ca2+-binding RTX toxin-like protein